MQCLLIVTLIGLTTVTIFQTYLFIQKFDGYYFIQYLAVYATSYYVSNILLHKVKSNNQSIQDYIVNLFNFDNTRSHNWSAR
jgi:hypothetical protein